MDANGTDLTKLEIINREMAAEAQVQNVCGNCRHFAKLQAEQKTVDERLAEAARAARGIKDPQPGECHFLPPQLIAIPLGGINNGQVQVQLQTLYPRLTDAFPACAQHEECRKPE